MSTETLAEGLNGFGSGAILIGEGRRADRVFTKAEFVSLCHYMLNENAQTEFLHAYLDSEGSPRFVKAKSTHADRRIAWAWDTISGRAKRNIAIGFYPWNLRGLSRWGAMDFDAHDGDAARAKTFAFAALDVLRRHPALFLLLCKSGSEGWHLFAFANKFCAVAEWIILFKQTAQIIGTEVKAGCCEIFPNETRTGGRPYGIRAPGTWNPKKNEIGAIFFEAVRPLFQKIEREEENTFLYRSTDGVQSAQLNDKEPGRFYTGGQARWLRQFAIVEPHTRHAQLRGLANAIFRQVGHRVGLKNAEAQYEQASPRPNATLAEHLEEFEELWAWIFQQWQKEVSQEERECFALLGTELEGDLFRVVRNFARHAESQGARDFPFPIQHVASRLGVTFQYVSKLRQKFADAGLIQQTVPARANSAAARFRWCLPL